MALHPIQKLLLALMPPTPEVIVDFEPYRKSTAAGNLLTKVFYKGAGPARERRRVTIPVEGGGVDLLVYFPFGQGPHPAHLFIHGGAWAFGSIDTALVDGIAQARCVETGSIVVSVNYRKAPEHKFPIPLNDCHAALLWIVENAKALNADLKRLSVGGQSAGGNMAAGLCLKVRDEGGPAIAGQFLEVPALDLSLSLPSCSRNAIGFGLTTKDTARARDWYLRSADDIRHPYASPLLAEDLSSLPPAFVISAEYDPLCDDGSEYVRRLQQAGVTATYHFGRGHTHGSAALTRFMASARAWQDALHTALRQVNQVGSI